MKTLNTSSCKSSPARTPKKATKIPPLLDPSRLRPPSANTVAHHLAGSGAGGGELAVGQQSKVNLTLGLQGRDLIEGCEIVTNPLHLQTPTERELMIMRNRMKTTSTMDEGILTSNSTERRSMDRLEDQDINDDIDIININSVHSRIA